jgi:hypothetical protein
MSAQSEARCSISRRAAEASAKLQVSAARANPHLPAALRPQSQSKADAIRLTWLLSRLPLVKAKNVPQLAPRRSSPPQYHLEDLFRCQENHA